MANQKNRMLYEKAINHKNNFKCVKFKNLHIHDLITVSNLRIATSDIL